jgi:hypothetical protein
MGIKQRAAGEAAERQLRSSLTLAPAFHPLAVRDALGLVRALFAVEREGIDLDRTTKLTEICTLGECLKMGIDVRDQPETLGDALPCAARPRRWTNSRRWSGRAHIAALVRVAQDELKRIGLRKLDVRHQKKAAMADRG